MKSSGMQFSASLLYLTGRKMNKKRLKEDSRKRRTINHDPAMESEYRKLLESQGWKPRTIVQTDARGYRAIYAVVAFVLASCLYIWVNGGV